MTENDFNDVPIADIVRDMRTAVASIDLCVNSPEADIQMALACANCIETFQGEWPEDISEKEVRIEAEIVVEAWAPVKKMSMPPKQSDGLNDFPEVQDALDNHGPGKMADIGIDFVDAPDALALMSEAKAALALMPEKWLKSRSHAFKAGWISRLTANVGQNDDPLANNPYGAEGVGHRNHHDWIGGWREANNLPKED